MAATGNKVTVKTNQPSPYQAPKKGTIRDKFQHLKLILAYRHYQRLLKRYSTLKENGIIADIGCGPGYLSSLLERWYPTCTIISFDYDFRLLENTRERTELANLVQGNAEVLPFGDMKFDFLITLHLIEHLFWPELFINEAKRVLKPGGILILATPNPNGIGATVMGKRQSGYREDHVSLKQPYEWAALCQDHGFKILHEKITGLTGIPIFRKFPLAILNWGLLALFGAFPRKYGEAYVAVFMKDL